MMAAGLMALLLPLQAAVRAAPPKEITVLAPASLVDALPRIAEGWTAASGVRVVFNFDSTSRLATQAAEGAPADALVSADEEWIAYLKRKGAPRENSRRALAGNRLVAVVPSSSTARPSSAAELGASVRHLALAGENVPAGRYAKVALESLKAWSAVERKIVRGDSVRTALKWVAAGEADAGIVYATDAASEPRVRVAFVFPAGSHPPIVYSAVVLRQSSRPEEAERFLEFCSSPAARPLWEKAGFPSPPR